MAQNLKDILTNLKQIHMTGSTLETLLDFERVLDEMSLYAFDNWKMGELVQGPIVSKYRVECKFMWPLKKMPDPSGGKRLLAYGIKISYEKSHLTYPVEVKTSDEFRPGTKMPQLRELPIWLVTINMPKALIKDITRGSIEIMDQEIDLEDLDQSYEENLDNESFQQEGAEAEEQPGALGMEPGAEQGVPGEAEEQQFAI